MPVAPARNQRVAVKSLICAPAHPRRRDGEHRVRPTTARQPAMRRDRQTTSAKTPTGIVAPLCGTSLTRRDRQTRPRQAEMGAGTVRKPSDVGVETRISAALRPSWINCARRGRFPQGFALSMEAASGKSAPKPTAWRIRKKRLRGGITCEISIGDAGRSGCGHDRRAAVRLSAMCSVTACRHSNGSTATQAGRDRRPGSSGEFDGFGAGPR